MISFNFINTIRNNIKIKIWKKIIITIMKTNHRDRNYP